MIKVENFSLGLTVESGQPLTFYGEYRKEERAEFLRYATAKGIFGVICRHEGVHAHIDYTFEGNYTNKEANAEITKRLGLEYDMEKIYEKIATDSYMKAAVKTLRGMRITQNDPWETTLCFVISQFNNIKRIRLIVRSLIKKFGEEYRDHKTETMHMFPTPESLASASISEIRNCGTGFRDRYVKQVAEQFAYGFDAGKLYKMNYSKAKEKLMELDGVGDKVADCILLFGYKKLEAFPIDVWIKRSMEKIYFSGKKEKEKTIHDFAEKRWGRYAGYAQQYIFHYARTAP